MHGQQNIKFTSACLAALRLLYAFRLTDGNNTQEPINMDLNVPGNGP
jgi:hypothetical protein